MTAPDDDELCILGTVLDVMGHNGHVLEVCTHHHSTFVLALHSTAQYTTGPTVGYNAATYKAPAHQFTHDGKKQEAWQEAGIVTPERLWLRNCVQRLTYPGLHQSRP